MRISDWSSDVCFAGIRGAAGAAGCPRRSGRALSRRRRGGAGGGSRRGASEQIRVNLLYPFEVDWIHGVGWARDSVPYDHDPILDSLRLNHHEKRGMHLARQPPPPMQPVLTTVRWTHGVRQIVALERIALLV